MFNSASKLAGWGKDFVSGGRLCSRLFRSNVLGVILLVSGWLQSREGVFDSTLARSCQSVGDFLLLFKTGRVKNMASEQCGGTTRFGCLKLLYR